MIKIENVDVYGFEASIRGMRSPMNSWDKSDSGWVSPRASNLFPTIYMWMLQLHSTGGRNLILTR